MARLYFLAAGLALVSHAAQPGAVKPVAAPMRDLAWGQINFLHTTDTHGWIGGHLSEFVFSMTGAAPFRRLQKRQLEAREARQSAC